MRRLGAEHGHFGVGCLELAVRTAECVAGAGGPTPIDETRPW